MSLWTKSCFRCGGDLYEERNLGGVDIVCLQCGHILTSAQEARLVEKTSERHPRPMRTAA